VDLTLNRLTISGENFLGENGRTVPSLFLGKTLLSQLSSSQTTIDATLPSGLDAGTYLLIVSNGPHIDDFDTFDVTIGAVGQQGPPGIPGRVGPRGGPGIANLTSVTTIGTVNINTNSFTDVAASCPSGLQVIGGGYTLSTEPSRVIVPIANYPSSSTSWLVRVMNNGGNLETPLTLTVYAICAVVQ